MLKDTFLDLSGHGYLSDMCRCQSGESYVILNMVHKFNHSQFDDVWLKCRFNNDDFPVFAKLDYYLANDRPVILKFDAKYSGFQQCYAGMSENDPRFILHLHGELLNVHEYYVKEAEAFYPDVHDMKSHKVLHRLRA